MGDINGPVGWNGLTFQFPAKHQDSVDQTHSLVAHPRPRTAPTENEKIN